MPAHCSHTNDQLKDILKEQGCAVQDRHEDIIKEFKDRCMTDFIYEVTQETLQSTEHGMLFQIGKGCDAKIVKVFIYVVGFLGDIIGLGSITNCGSNRKAMPCRMCSETNMWDFSSAVDENYIVPWRDSELSEKAGRIKSQILRKKYLNDIAGSNKNIITPEERDWDKLGDLNSISILDNNVYKVTRPLDEADIVSFHRLFRTELLHMLKLGPGKHVPAVVVSLIRINQELQKKMFGKLEFDEAMAMMDDSVKEFPVLQASQTYFPVRKTKMRTGISEMIHSEATHKTNSSFFLVPTCVDGNILCWYYS
jgi:hypothetical protein